MYFVKNMFWKFQGKFFKKYLQLSSFFIKQQASSLQLYLKWTPSQVFSRIFLNYRNVLFPEHLFWVIVGRGLLTPPLLWRWRTHIVFTQHFLKFVKPLFSVASNFHLDCPFWCRLSLTEWVIMPHLMCYGSISLGTFVPEWPCHVFHTHTHKDTQHTHGPIGWHTHVNLH